MFLVIILLSIAEDMSYAYCTLWLYRWFVQGWAGFDLSFKVLFGVFVILGIVKIVFMRLKISDTQMGQLAHDAVTTILAKIAVTWITLLCGWVVVSVIF